jgi:hypothetical protein
MQNQMDKYENIFIHKKDPNEQVHKVLMPEVVDYYSTNHKTMSKQLISETFNLFSQTQLMQKQVTEDYNQIEKQFVQQEMHLENLKQMKNMKDNKIVKNNILF